MPVHTVCGGQRATLLSHLSVCLDLGAVVCRAAVGVCTRRAALPRPPAARALRSRYSLPVGAMPAASEEEGGRFGGSASWALAASATLARSASTCPG